MSIIYYYIIDKVINVHEEVKKKLEESSTKYKANTNKQKCFKSFTVRDQVMVHLWNDTFPVGEAKEVGPFHILQKINDNAYVVDLPANYNISKLAILLNQLKDEFF